MIKGNKKEESIFNISKLPSFDEIKDSHYKKFRNYMLYYINTKKL